MKKLIKKAKKGKLPCQLINYNIDFEDIGWDDWILSPPTIDLNLCLGSCEGFPLPDHMNTTNHAIFQNLYHGSKERGEYLQTVTVT